MASDEEKRKREVFDGMSLRRQQRILKKGYDKWDPFLAPKEPPFFNQEERGRIRDAALRFEQFMMYMSGEEGQEERLSSSYVQGARDICFGLAKEEERYQGMLDFCTWFTKIRDSG